MRPITMLQTFDSSRYRRDARLDRMIDVAHARSETVVAQLFGYEIVLPANDVADSPAVQTVLTEIASGAKDFCNDFRKKNGHPFAIFSIGVDRRHSTGGYEHSGYNGFANAYRASMRAERDERLRPRELVSLQEQRGDWSNADMVCGMVSAYLGDEPDWERALERDHPASHAYAKLVRSLFNQRSNSEVRLSYSSGNLPDDYKRTFAAFARSALDRAARRSTDVERPVIERVSAALNRLLASNASLRKRADWGEHADRFEDDWEIIRDWLDIAVYGNLFRSFGVQIGSYFTQECTSDGVRNTVRMGAVTDRAYGTLFDGQGGLALPQLDHVDWNRILTYSNSAPVRNAISRFHLRLAEAKLQRGPARTAALEDARRRHVDFLLNDQEERLIVETYLDARGGLRREASTSANAWGSPLEGGLRVACKIAGILLKSQGPVGDLQQLALEEGVGRIAQSGIGRSVATLLRPSQALAEREGSLLISRELDRLNFWIR